MKKIYGDREYILKLKQELTVLKIVLCAVVVVAILLFLTCQNLSTALFNI
jgi:hypothetical protein